MKKVVIKEYIQSKLIELDYADDFSGLDSFDKLEFIMGCEVEFTISIDESEIMPDYTTEMLVDYIYNLLN